MKLAGNTPLLEAHIGVFNYRKLVRIDWWLALIVCFLGLIGILTLISASRSVSIGSLLYWKQLAFLIGGCGAALAITCTDHRFLVSLAPYVYVAVLALLIAVHFAGLTVKGGQRWLDLGLFSIQPSEFSKLALVFLLAWYLSAIGPRIKKLPYFILALILAGIPGALILKQPNLGTAATLVPMTLALLYVAGCKRWHLIAVILAGLAVSPFAWRQMDDYQQRRMISFLDPAADPQGSGYQTLQSMITVGSGGLTGKGYLQGTQTPLKYLPEHHNDFIFSLLAEEWGFAGSATLLVLFSLLFARGLRIARECQDTAGSLLAVGVVAILAFHVFVNIAITVGILPITGIPLPFMSYGGSFYLVTMLGIGVLLSVQMGKGMFDH